MLARYDRASRPADVSAILQALSVLAAMTVRQDDADHGVIIAATRAYAEALSRFPADIALHVVQTWPDTAGGKWWPTLHELMSACRELYAPRLACVEALRRAASTAPPGDDGAGPYPIGATARFVERVRAARGDAYVYSWLNRRNCRFTASAVLTTAFMAERLQRDVGQIADDCGVEILEGARYAQDDEHGDAEPAPVRRLYVPRTEEPTDEERAEGARVLRDLMQTLNRSKAK